MSEPSAGIRVYTLVMGALVASLVGLIIWAWLEKSVIEIFVVLWKERWGVVTLLDLYGGFVISATWICLLERRPARAIPWLVGMFCFGNLATAVYVLWRARRAKSLRGIFMGEPPSEAVARSSTSAGA